MAISDKRIQSSVQYLIRKRMESVINEAGTGHTFSELTQMVLTPDKDKGLVNQILNQCRPVYPIKRMDIRRMEILSMPEGEDKTTNILSAPVPPGPEEPTKSADASTPAIVEKAPDPEPTPPA
jgi:ribosomal protein S3AE